jgi:hypothetical protein
MILEWQLTNFFTEKIFDQDNVRAGFEEYDPRLKARMERAIYSFLFTFLDNFYSILRMACTI